MGRYRYQMGRYIYEEFPANDEFECVPAPDYGTFRENLAYEAELQARSQQDARDALFRGRTAWSLKKIEGVGLAADLAIDMVDAAGGDAFLDAEMEAANDGAPTLETHFAEHYHRLRLLLETCSVLPARVTERWLSYLSFEGPLHFRNGRRKVETVLSEYWIAYSENQPSLHDVHRGLHFIKEMEDIKAELKWLKRAFGQLEISLME